ncbi:MAG: hypothetical protein A2161_09005 [Candidatus Schekmanbacteria bacterium RBG_13_48_7]|uniref:Ion-translocating oxidoreductase complex subunit C n=1 Tax=Candidatus Schekmanbacteria bacterium RBG_13_48_7 TaxID=1817878 RepID=A0A1F7RPL2_9BACT|nr:MAG: hypothetical protein A2161_09005 [Candidatus Schekmanbacteria bacterium RBG_13_48_7]
MIAKRKTFPGGAHPPESKTLTERKGIEALPLPKEVFIPVQQHLGAPAKVVVNKGDIVKIGQVLAEASAYVSVPTHASISGKVKSVDNYPHPFGIPVMSVQIEGDGTETWDETCLKERDYRSLSSDEIRNIIRDSGLAGMGGAAFPTHVKLNPPKEKPIDTVILNGAECEPYLTADHVLMRERGKEILEGLRIFMHVLGCKQGFIGIEANKEDAAKFLKSLIKPADNIEVIVLPVKYPQGAEKQLIYAIKRRKVPAGGLPMDVGCLVQNVGTAVAAYNAVVRGIPFISRVVTVTGRSLQKPSNIQSPLGTPIRDLVDFCGGLPEGTSMILMGGPMMGMAQYNLDAPVIKGTSGLLILGKDEIGRWKMRPCIGCGRCVQGCPMNLMPNLIGMYVEYGKFEWASKMHVLDCIECGTCSYVCPSGRNLVHLVKFGKFKILQEKKKSIKAMES